MNTKRTVTSTNERNKNIACALQDHGALLAQAITDAMVTCLACSNFDEPRELCLLANKRPPARVIAHGCPMFDPIVPF